MQVPRRLPRSVGARAGRFDHAAPFRDFGFDEVRELPLRQASRRRTLVGEIRDQVRRLERRRDFVAELSQRIARRRRRREDAVPVFDFITRNTTVRLNEWVNC